jgi:hypothetical protein
VAFLDEKGNWVGPGPDPRSAGSFPTAPAKFDVNTIPSVTIPSGKSVTDWTNLIQGNSGYMGWKLSAAERADIAAANRRAALRALAIRYGGLPQGFKDVYGDLSEQDLETARANPLSESSRLQKSYGESIEMTKRQLAARRALQSGDLGHALGQLDYQHSADLYDLNQSVMDAAQAYVNSYSGTLSGLNSEQIDAIRQAAGDTYSMGYRLGGGLTGTGGVGGKLQYTSGALEALSKLGYSDEDLYGMISGYAKDRGWGPYSGSGGEEGYGIQQNGQLFNADGSPYSGSGQAYLSVKVGTPGGNSTELIPISAPPGAQTEPPVTTPADTPVVTTSAITPSVRQILAQQDAIAARQNPAGTKYYEV